MKNIYAAILAGGLSKRMKSKIPKVFHKVSGKMMIEWSLEAALSINPDKTFVIGNSENEGDLKRVCSNYENVEVVLQEESRGTGDAVNTLRDLIDMDSFIYVAPGDAPLIKHSTVKSIFETALKEDADAVILTAEVPNPYGYGRIVRDGNKLLRIVEHRDANEWELSIKEVNGGFYVFKSGPLFEALKTIKPNNSQGEYYLTDVFENMSKVVIYKTDDWEEILGVNNRKQLSEVERVMQNRIKDRFMDKGITFIMPETVYIEYSVDIGEDSVIYPNVVLLGKTRIGRDCVIGPFRVLKDENIPDGTILLP